MMSPSISVDQDPVLISEHTLSIMLRSSLRGVNGLVISLPRSGVSEHESSFSSQDSRETDFTYMNKIQRVILTSSDFPIDDCSICLDVFKCRQHCARLQCGHVFHRQCIDSWLKMQVHCPICRACTGKTYISKYTGQY